jgi:hypothetical protein
MEEELCSSRRRQSIIQTLGIVAAHWQELVRKLLHAGIEHVRLLRSRRRLQD